MKCACKIINCPHVRQCKNKEDDWHCTIIKNTSGDNLWVLAYGIDVRYYIKNIGCKQYVGNAEKFYKECPNVHKIETIIDLENL